MTKRITAALTAVFIAVSLTACGTISPPVQTATTVTTEAPITETTTTAVTTSPPVESITETVTTQDSSSELSEEEKRQLEQDTFIAEFFDSQIKFEDTKAITEDPLRTNQFECESESNGIEKITVKGKNGSGAVDVMVIDLSGSGLSYDLDTIIDTFGDYYFGITSQNMTGVSEDEFSSKYRMTSSVVSKGKFERTASVQKSDGSATQFGYVKTYAVLLNNTLTVVSGQFLSIDMMERQGFTALLTAMCDNVRY